MTDDAHHEADDPVLDALWRRALEAWDDDTVHAALLDHAVRAQWLPELAGRYRALASDPEKGDVAKRAVDKIVTAATQMLMTTKTARPGKVPLPITLSAFAVCLLLLGWLALGVWGR